MGSSFTEEQKQYLQGFMAGLQQRGGTPFAGMTPEGTITDDPSGAERSLSDPPPAAVYGTPVDDLCKQERIKLAQNPMDMWDAMVDHALEGRFPEGDDVFRFKSRGLFYVAPAQDAFMLRCRIPGCMLTPDQLRGITHIAEAWGRGYADITTRGNLQIREIGASDGIKALEKLYEIGLTSKGAGADNVRNVTASPTAGFDPYEVYDVRPLALAMHHYILNSADLYGLPRKFNIAFDNGGSISVASDTNDIGFQAVRVAEGRNTASGPYFRVRLGGVTGHRAFAEDSELLLEPEQCVAVAAAMLRVYIENGNRTFRKKARLKYLLDDWGIPRFIEETERKLAFSLASLPAADCIPRSPVVRHGHVGVHPQAQEGLNYIGVVVPVGRLTVDQMKGLADLAETVGSGELRLTVFQNIILPGIPEARIDEVKERLVEVGLHYRSTSVSGGLVACTGNVGCQYAMTDTKGQALALADYLEENIPLDQSINIHLTGCPHSCAQHYCGDIGLLGTKVKADGASVEAYNVLVGGGMDQDQGLGRKLFANVPFDDVPVLLEGVLKTYLDERADDEESFVAFTRRHEIDELEALFNEAAGGLHD